MSKESSNSSVTITDSPNAVVVVNVNVFPPSECVPQPENPPAANAETE